VWLEYLADSRFRISPSWLGGTLLPHRLSARLKTAAATAYRLAAGRRVTVSAMSEHWLCCYAVETGKRQDDL
jgi:hypothetical protein